MVPFESVLVPAEAGFFSGQFSFTEKIERIAQEPLVIVRLLDHTWLLLNTRIYSIASESKYSSSFVLILL